MNAKVTVGAVALLLAGGATFLVSQQQNTQVTVVDDRLVDGGTGVDAGVDVRRAVDAVTGCPVTMFRCTDGACVLSPDQCP